MTATLAGLFVYPVKSLRGISVEAAAIAGGRLAGDREWLLVDGHGQFMHARDYPRMVRLRPSPVPGGLVISGDAGPTLEVTAPGRAAPVLHVQLWRRQAPVRHVSPAADAWFTRELGVTARLMAFAPDAEARLVPSYEVNASLQDATPFHLTSQESLNDLNRRMAVPVPMNRFRPNLVVAGAEPYAEDQWHQVRVGGTRLRWIKPCTRCVLTTTDQETGERLSKEPLRTLSTYRRVGNEVVFGHYFTADDESGTLRIGDPVG